VHVRMMIYLSSVTSPPAHESMQVIECLENPTNAEEQKPALPKPRPRVPRRGTSTRRGCGRREANVYAYRRRAGKGVPTRACAIMRMGAEHLSLCVSLVSVVVSVPVCIVNSFGG
jgi:hypothetical protein